MAPTEGRVAKPEQRWDRHHGTPDKDKVIYLAVDCPLYVHITTVNTRFTKTINTELLENATHADNVTKELDS